MSTNEAIGNEFSFARRTSPITPVLQILNVSPGLIVTVLVVGIDLWVAGIAAGLLILGTFGYWLSWRKRSFWINAENELEVTSGIFFRRSRQLRISRLQSVDIMRPFIARVAGYSSLKVEVAGGGDSRVLLSYLSVEQAQTLRSKILDLAKHEAQVSESSSIEIPSDSEWQWQRSVPNPLLVASLALTTSTYFLIIGVVVSISFAILDPFGGTGLLTFALAIGGAFISLLTGITSLFNFSIGRSDRGIAISHGLITTANYTVSPTRVQALALVQPFAWRLFHWHQVVINVAGTDQGSQKSGPRVLIPVIHERDLSEFFSEVLPAWNLGLDRDWIAADHTAKWRFPWQARRLAVSVNPDLLMFRTGALTLRMSAAPHARIQSIRLTQGPWEAMLGISTLHADSVPGPVRLRGRGLKSGVAAAAAISELDLMASARELTISENW